MLVSLRYKWVVFGPEWRTLISSAPLHKETSHFSGTRKRWLVFLLTKRGRIYNNVFIYAVLSLWRSLILSSQRTVCQGWTLRIDISQFKTNLGTPGPWCSFCIWVPFTSEYHFRLSTIHRSRGSMVSALESNMWRKNPKHAWLCIISKILIVTLLKQKLNVFSRLHNLTNFHVFLHYRIAEG